MMTDKELAKEIVVALVAAGKVINSKEASDAYVEIYKTIDTTKSEATIHAGRINF